MVIVIISGSGSRGRMKVILSYVPLGGKRFSESPGYIMSKNHSLVGIHWPFQFVSIEASENKYMWVKFLISGW